MGPFRFRAQPALELRRREHDAAQRELARADAERLRARQRLELAEEAFAEAQREADTAARTEGTGTDHEWYRFWIVRLDRERAARKAELETHDAALAAARTACLTARQRREALERFRDKAFTAHRALEAAVERRAIDELATQRHARRDNTEGA